MVEGDFPGKALSLNDTLKPRFFFNVFLIFYRQLSLCWPAKNLVSWRLPAEAAHSST
jgi:hypothetical protein